MPVQCYGQLSISLLVILHSSASTSSHSDLVKSSSVAITSTSSLNVFVLGTITESGKKLYLKEVNSPFRYLPVGQLLTCKSPTYL